MDKTKAGRRYWPSEDERFTDRTAAGRAVGRALAEKLTGERPGTVTGERPGAVTGGEWADAMAGERPIVLGLAPGGVPVAMGIASVLQADLDIVVAVQIGLPWSPMASVGAIAGDGAVMLDHDALANAGAATIDLPHVVRRERIELGRRLRRYRGAQSQPDLTGRVVVLADDGLTPGIAVRAALRSIRAGNPARVVFAAPVCAAELADRIDREVDASVYLHSPRVFHALGLWYRDLAPVADGDVAAILAMTRDLVPPEQTAAPFG